MRKCPECGAEASEEDNFCRKCGAKLTSTTPSPKRLLKITRRKTDSPTVSSSIREAFITLVAPTPPVNRPAGAVYEAKPYGPVGKYLIIGAVLFLAGMILSTGGLFLSVSLSFIIAVSVAPLAYFLWMYVQDRTEAEPIELIVLSAGWGAFSAFLVILFWTVLAPDIDAPAWIGGPLPEEPVKILAVYWLATHRRLGSEFNDHLDGMVYGAAVGAGFMMAENFMYVAYMLSEGVSLTAAVLIRSSIGHIFYSALAGRWLGLAKARRGKVQVGDLVPGLAVAMTLHGLWNSPLADPIFEFFYYMGGDYGFIASIFLVASPYYLILYKYVREALRDEKRWEQNLSRASEG